MNRSLPVRRPEGNSTDVRPSSFARLCTAWLLTLLIAATGIATSGCGGQTALLQRQGVELDSMYAVNRELRQELRSLRDTLRFYDDIHSGQYYRDRRVLVQEIDRLEYSLSLCRDGGQTFETLLVDDLFEPASAELTESGAALVAALADTLEDISGERMIRVEGHSDSTPIGPSLAETYPSNWELSTARASSVARRLIEEHGISADRLEVAGFGSMRPVAPNTTADGKRSNRRVRIAVMPE